MNDIINVITTLGYPIFISLCLGWYVKYITDNNRKDMERMRIEHNEEVAKMSEALNNNTLALQKLIDKLDGVLKNES